jgi:hypothetical protein
MAKTFNQFITEAQAGYPVTKLLSPERFDKRGKPDPNGQFALSPLNKASGKLIRDAMDACYDSVIKAYGGTQTMAAKDLTTTQRFVNVARVQEYISNPNRPADIAKGRVSNTLLAVKRGDIVAVVDGNHRAAAAALKDKRLTLTVVDMDAAFDDAEKIAKPEWGLHYALMKAAEMKIHR